MCCVYHQMHPNNIMLLFQKVNDNIRTFLRNMEELGSEDAEDRKDATKVLLKMCGSSKESPNDIIDVKFDSFFFRSLYLHHFDSGWTKK